MRNRFAVLVLLALMAVGAFFFVRKAPSKYPEFDAVSSSALEKVRAVLPVKKSARRLLLKQAQYDPARLLAGCDPFAVLAVLHEQSTSARHYAEYGPPYEDKSRRPASWWLASQSDKRLNAVLLKILHDPDLAFDIKDIAIAAMCWEGNHEVVAPLTKFVLNIESPSLLRTRVLLRVHRIGIRPPLEFETLLFQPFGDLDWYAAAALARLGHPVAPGWVAEGLVHFWDNNALGSALVEATEVIAGHDRQIARIADVAAQDVKDRWVLDPDGPARVEHPLETKDFEGLPMSQEFLDDVRSKEVSMRQTLRALGKALTIWLAQNPSSSTNPLEREWAAYAESTAYRRSRAVQNHAQAYLIRDEDFDFGAAAIACVSSNKAHATRALNAIDRLAILLRNDVRGIEDPHAILEAMHARILQRGGTTFSGWEGHPSSFLYGVLRDHTGNCVGLTSLYLALGERLDLPLVAVDVPEHVFLRWDDVQTSFDVELTQGGRLRTADELKDVPAQVLTKKELVSVILSNRAAAYITTPTSDADARRQLALNDIERALLWNPKNGRAYLIRAKCLSQSNDLEGALRSASHAASLMKGQAFPLLMAGEVTYENERLDDALTWFDRAMKLDPKCLEAFQGRLRCLERLGRHREVAMEIQQSRDFSNDTGVRGILLRAKIRLSKPDWREDLRALDSSSSDGWQLRVNTAELLIACEDPNAAIEVLDGLRGLEEQFKSESGLIPDRRSGFELLASRLRAKALELRTRAQGILTRR